MTKLFFSTLDYQSTPQFIGTPPVELNLDLQTLAFPLSIPLDYRNIPDFEALKIGSKDGYLIISYVYDGQAVDDWKRPILSSKSIGIEISYFRQTRASVTTIRQFLAETDFENESLETLASIYDNKHQQSDSIKEVLPLNSLAHVVHNLICGEQMAIYSGEPTPYALLAQSLHWLPDQTLKQLNLSTVCADLESMAHENIVFVGYPPVKNKWTFKSLFNLKHAQDELCHMDLTAQNMPIIKAKYLSPEVILEVLTEAKQGLDWFPLSPHEKLLLLLRWIERLSQGDNINISHLLQGQFEELAPNTKELILQFEKRAS